MSLSFRKGTDINDWTYATGDLPRTRWALTDFEGHVQLRSLSSPDTTSEFFTSPRKVSALIRFSPGGRWLAIRHRDELGIWDTTPGATQPLAFVCKPWIRENPFGFMKMSFAPDDGAVIWPDGPSIVATALPAGTEMARWKVQGEGKARVSALAFEMGGYFFALSHDHSPTVELRHWPSGEQKRIFSSQLLRPAVAIAVSPGAKWIAAGDESGKITAWRGDFDSERQLEFRGHTDTIRSLAFSRDGRYLASSSEDSMVRFWSIAAESEVASLAWDVGVPSISDDNLSYGVGAAMDHMTSAELGPSPILHRFRPEPGARAMQYVSILPDGNSLWCLSDTGPVQCALPEGELIASHAGTNLEQIIADPVGNGAVFATGNETLHRWETDRAESSAIFLAPDKGAWSGLAASADDRWLAAWTRGLQAVIWPAGDRDATRARQLAQETGGFMGLALSPDGSRAAVSHRYVPDLNIFDVNTGHILHTLPLKPAHSPAWSPDGKWLAANGSTTLLGETSTWKMEILPFIAPCHFPAGVAIFSRPDSNGQSRLLAVVNGDSRIALIALPERRLIANLESPGGLPISDLEFSRDQRWLVAGAAQGEIQVWDLDIIRARLEEMKCSW